DEFYVKSGLPFPLHDYYQGYPQMENGIGKARFFLYGFKRKLGHSRLKFRKIAVLTSVSARNVFSQVKRELRQRGVRLDYFCVPSRFWGPQVTVAGLLTGSDLRDYITDHLDRLRQYERIFVSRVTLNDDRLFLDGLQGNLSDLSSKIRFCADSGSEFADCLIE
ncbi:MAG: DUF512 domain-containing protein, partial [Candidatus Wallbacteria bacterium]|nr:DUF512 domain-containing protein [Candidatus Wallbacteria bacterium]